MLTRRHFAPAVLAASIVAGASVRPVAAGELARVTPPNDFHAQVTGLASEWRRAVQEADSEQLVSLGWPDERSWIAAQLGSQASVMYRALFTGPESISSRLARILVAPVVFKHVRIPNPYFTVCWATDRDTRLWPTDSEALYALDGAPVVYCHDFVGDGNGGLYASFDFAKDADW